jgi:putative oxidoreductase
MQFLERLKPVSLLLLRCALGMIFMTHGYPKLFTETPRFTQFFQSLGFAGYLVYIVGVLELFGGGMLIAGLATRPVALLLTGEMAVAIWKVHLGHGIYAVRNYEFPLAVAVGAFALATVGAGVISLDNFVFPGRARPKPKPSKG